MILEGEMNFGKKTKIEKISLANQPCAWTWKKISKKFSQRLRFFLEFPSGWLSSYIEHTYILGVGKQIFRIFIETASHHGPIMVGDLDKFLNFFFFFETKIFFFLCVVSCV
jgi:hypothetical protein